MVGPHQLDVLREREAGRTTVSCRLRGIVQSHYDDPANIAEAVAMLGYPGAADMLRQQLPTVNTKRSGDLGEILATEYVDRHTRFQVPIRRLRYKDGRNNPMRGDDVIGVAAKGSSELEYLKGEVKSEVRMQTRTIQNARAALNKNSGEVDKASLYFVVKRLLERNDPVAQALARSIRDGVSKHGIATHQMCHMIFALSGNSADGFLKADLTTYSGPFSQISANLVIDDHAPFVSSLYESALSFGDA